MSDYLHSAPEDCQQAGDHLLSCDDDGFCNACGHQDIIVLYGVRLSDDTWMTTLDGSAQWVGDLEEMTQVAQMYDGTTVVPLEE